MRGQHSSSEGHLHFAGVRTWVRSRVPSRNLASGQAQVSVACEEQGVIYWSNGMASPLRSPSVRKTSLGSLCLPASCLFL